MLDLLGPCAVDVVSHIGLPQLAGRSGWPLLHILQLVRGVQGVVLLTLAVKLNALGLPASNVASHEVGLRLVEADVQVARARTLDVPVLVGKLRLVHFARSMELGRGAFAQ